MNFKQKLADFVLGNRTTSQHPDIALTAMEEQRDSEALIILAGMNDKDNSFELEQYFQQMLSELEISLPTKIEAAYELLHYLTNRMVNFPTESYQLMIRINSINNDFPQSDARKPWLLNAFKKAAKNIKRNSNYKVWQVGNQPKLLETKAFSQQKLDYVHNNPVEAEIVDEAHEYTYSSARDYCGMKGLLDIELIQ